ncbi:MAG: T9SS type A sorting domain-containing protein [Fidelibacterota bacterium]
MLKQISGAGILGDTTSAAIETPFETVPLDFTITATYPNPFNSSVTIQFEMYREEDISIRVFDLLGQEVRTLLSGKIILGKHTISWDGVDNGGKKVSSGIYFYRLTSEQGIRTRKLVVLK